MASANGMFKYFICDYLLGISIFRADETLVLFVVGSPKAIIILIQ